MIFAALLLVADAPIDGAPQAAPRPVLEMTRPIVDQAGVLGDAAEEDLSHRIHQHLDESGVAVGVLIVPTLGGKSIKAVSEAAIDAFQAGFGNGHSAVLAVIALQDRVMRVSGDERLKETLTDRDIARLVDSATKSFRDGDVNGGVTTLVQGIIDKTPTAPVDRRARIIGITLAVGAGVIALAILFALLSRRRGAETGAQTG
jgi:uncharacterized protein